MAERVSTTQRIQGWIDRLRAGDESARAALLECAADRLTRLTRKMLRSFPRVRRWEETEDVLQNAALRLHRALADVQPTNVQEFFRLAALNIRRELLDLARHYYGPQGVGAKHATWKPDRTSGENLHPAEAQPDLSDDPDRLVAWTEFHRKIETLPEEERQMFDLLWYQGLSQAEAGEVLNISERTIKRRWRAARLKLHEALDGESPGT